MAAAAPNSNATLLIVLEAQSQKLQNQLVQVTRQIDKFAAQTEKRFQQMNAANAASFDKLGTQIKGSLGTASAALAALGLGTGIKQVLDYANSWETLKNKLKSASTYSGLQAQSLEDITTAASAARTPLEDYVRLYSRMLNIAGPLRLTQLQVADATDTISKAFKVGGATAQEQAAGITQITQALGAGLVQGQDLRAIKNDAPVIAQALASFFNTTVGGLKKLGAQGKITSEDFLKAILAYRDKINAAFNSTQVTISDAVTKIKNAFLEFVGTTGESSGAIQKLVDALNYLADNFKTIAPIVLDFVAIIAGALAANAFVGFVGGIGEAVAALGVFLSTIAAGEFSVVAFSAAMGPMALIVGAAATAFWLLNTAGDQLSTTLETLNGDTWNNSKAIDQAKNSSVAFRTELGKQIDTQIQAAEAALQEANAQLAAAKTKADAARIFANVMSGIGGAIGVSNGENRGDQYASEILDPAQKRISDAQAAIATLKGQANLLSWQNYMNKPGTADQAPGVGGSDNGTTTKTKGDKYDSAKDSILKQTDALNAETAAQSKVNPLINDYGFAMDKAKMSSDLLTAAQASGRKVTPELSAAIDTLATNYAMADSAAKKFAESQKQLVSDAETWRDTLKGATSGFINDLINGKTAAEALGNALSSIGNQLLSMGLDALLGGGSNKTQQFGALGSLFGFADGGIAANGRPMPLKHFADGGVSSTAAIFGETGNPEAAIPLKGGKVPVSLSMPKGGFGGGSMNITYAPTIHAPGADSATVAKLAQVVATDRANFESKVIGSIRAAKKKRQM